MQHSSIRTRDEHKLLGCLGLLAQMNVTASGYQWLPRKQQLLESLASNDVTQPTHLLGQVSSELELFLGYVVNSTPPIPHKAVQPYIYQLI